MKATIRVVLLALVATLSFTSVGAATAAAPATGEARAANACTVAGDVLAKRQANKKKLRKQRKAARKRFNKAKKVRNKAKAKNQVKKLKKAKVRVKKTRKQFRKARNKVKRINVRIKSAQAGRTKACAPAKPGKPGPGTPATPEERQADALGQLLLLITNNLGGGNPLAALSLDDLTELLNTLLPGIGDQLDANILEALLGGITGGSADPAVILDLLGGADPSQLLALLDALSGGLDGFDPAQFTGVFEDLLGQLAALGGGDFTEVLSPAGVLGLLGLVVDTLSDNVLGALGLDMVGDLLQGLLNGVNPSAGQISDLTNLVGDLNPGQIDQLLDVSLLAALVGGLTNGTNGLPGLSDLPVLGPILGGLVCGLPIIGPILCGIL